MKTRIERDQELAMWLCKAPEPYYINLIVADWRDAEAAMTDDNETHYEAENYYGDIGRVEALRTVVDRIALGIRDHVPGFDESWLHR